MKPFKIFALTSCLGLALAAVPATAQDDQKQPNQDQQQTQQQRDQQSQSLPATPPATENQADQSQLPRTASPMPLVGLAGLLSLGAAGVLRATRR